MTPKVPARLDRNTRHPRSPNHGDRWIQTIEESATVMLILPCRVIGSQAVEHAFAATFEPYLCRNVLACLRDSSRGHLHAISWQRNGKCLNGGLSPQMAVFIIVQRTRAAPFGCQLTAISRKFE